MVKVVLSDLQVENNFLKRENKDLKNRLKKMQQNFEKLHVEIRELHERLDKRKLSSYNQDVNNVDKSNNI